MSLAQFADVHFGYPGTEILTGATLLIRPGDRLALVGPNGTGKSTALRLLAGDLAADSGDVRILGQASVSYLRQSQEFTGSGLLLDADVGFTEADLSRPVETLSGGERGRLELAKVLVQKPDLLLLDEPTNHLDLTAIERLEAFLGEYPGAFLLVSHDRTFIQRTCKEMVELEDGRFVRYPMTYDRYVVERAARLERARVEYERQKQHVDRTEDFIRRNIAGQKTKQAQS